MRDRAELNPQQPKRPGRLLKGLLGIIKTSEPQPEVVDTSATPRKFFLMRHGAYEEWERAPFPDKPEADEVVRASVQTILDAVSENADAPRRVGLFWTEKNRARRTACIALQMLEADEDKFDVAGAREINTLVDAWQNQLAEYIDRLNVNDVVIFVAHSYTPYDIGQSGDAMFGFSGQGEVFADRREYKISPQMLRNLK